LWPWCIVTVSVFTGIIARQYLSYSEGDFEVFTPLGQHIAPIGGEIWRRLVVKLCVRPSKVFKVQQRAKFGGARISPAPGMAKTLSFLSVCLSVCLSDTHLSVTFCAHNFAMNALEYRNSFDAIG